MRGRVIITEGLPGSGKSTLLHDLAKDLSRDFDCECFREETSQPLDLFRQAVVPSEVFDSAIGEFKRTAQTETTSLLRWIEKNSYFIGNLCIAAYTQVDGENAAIRRFAANLREYDLGDGRSSFEEYSYYHKLVWNNFAANIYDPQKVYISEGALLHNQLFDLIGFYNLNDEAIYRYYTDLLAEIDPDILQIEYIDVDSVDSLIKHTEASRPGWRQRLENWLRHAPWAQQRQYTGDAGIRKLYHRIQNVHAMFRERMGIRVNTHLRTFCGTGR